MTINDIATTFKLLELLQDDCDDLSHFIVESSKNASLMKAIAGINDAILSTAVVLNEVVNNLSEKEKSELDAELDAIEEDYDYDEEE